MKSTKKIPFLKQVANVYALNEADSLMDYCFVFPNKRSATFFASFLSEIMPRASIMPDIITISDFIASLSPLVEANRYEQLFTLYKEYSNQPDIEIEFDRFLFWGEMLISDFNDVDRYLINPEQLFGNVKKLKEISTNYLSAEQEKVIERFWGERTPAAHVEHFWNHLDYDDKKGSKTKFIKLWEILLPLYRVFNRKLAERGLTSNGMLYRNAVNVLKNNEADNVLTAERYIFVGFNVLSTSEIQIFSTLQKRKRADFYWDFNSPALRIADNRARRFIAKNIKEFPSIYQLKEDEIDTLPKIKIIGVPSAIGQVKVAAGQISKWVEDRVISDSSNATDTAIVLPDESLFIPMIHSMPSAITSLNVTMGFPMKLSPVSSLFKEIIRLQLRTRKSHGEMSFFYEDVKPLLTTPLLSAAAPDECIELARHIMTNRLFQIPVSDIATIAPTLTPVFNPIGNLAQLDTIRAYIEELCDFLSKHIDQSDKIGLHFIESYREACNSLCIAAKEFGIDMHGFALFQMVERTVNSGSVSFVGEPLAGLQMMGVLETRAIDFTNVIMLSMNEKVFPRKLYTRSFIPDTLRKGYGMATLDFQESIFAYYFYRLLSRADNVTLIYDARRVGGSRSNELSRYLNQLLYIFGDNNVEHTLGVYHSIPIDEHPVEIKRNARVRDKLAQYRPEHGKKHLSASAINAYINCPLEFYLRFVEGYNAEDDITDYVDFSTFGTILHEVMETIYTGFQAKDADGRPLPAEITSDMLDPYINETNKLKLDRIITATINRCFNKFTGEKLHTPLAGETLVLSHIFREAVIEMLRVDRGYTPFTFVAAEYKMDGVVKINENLSVNVRQIIDRIDIVNGTMRFVDYKTGDDKIDSSSIEDLFNGNNPNRAKVLFQLLMYCHIYRSLENDQRPIQPMVYKMRSLMTQGVKPSEIGAYRNRQGLYDYNDFYEEFLDRFNALIEEIVCSDKPFTQNKSDHSCKFCQFKSLCSQED